MQINIIWVRFTKGHIHFLLTHKALKFNIAGTIIQLTAILFMACNGILFIHFHHVSGGNIITHAHPYFSNSDSPIDPGHSHSEQEMEFLKFMGSPECLLPGLCTLTSRAFSCFSIIGLTAYLFDSHSTFLNLNSGRAPPSGAFS